MPGNNDEMDMLVGKSLGQFRIVERIGSGGMATVFKAYQPALDRYVAVKVLPSYHAQDEVFVKRFRQEARAVAKLQHPNIVQIHDLVRTMSAILPTSSWNMSMEERSRIVSKRLCLFLRRLII